MRRFWVKAAPFAVIAIAGIVVIAQPGDDRCPAGEVCPPPPDCVSTEQAQAVGSSAMTGPGRGLDPFGFNDGSVLAGQAGADEVALLHSDIKATLIRFALDWRRVEPNPRAYDFTAEDEIYCAAIERGIAPVIAIAAAPAWAAVRSDGCKECLRPPAREHLEALAELARLVAERYPGAAAIEAWNEPNLPLFWENPNPDRYAEVLAAVSRGVGSAGTAVPVLGGSLANASGSGKTSARLEQFVDRLYSAGGGQSMDALAIHPYPVFPAQDRRQRFDDMLRLVRRVTARHGFRDQPIWITELGLRTEGGVDHSHVAAEDPALSFTPAEQAATMEALYRQASDDPQIEAVIFHTLVEPDGRVASRGGYGWLAPHSDGYRPKPVWCRILAMTKPERACSPSIDPG